jgi:hypothetical protein
MFARAEWLELVWDLRIMATTLTKDLSAVNEKSVFTLSSQAFED